MVTRHRPLANLLVVSLPAALLALLCVAGGVEIWTRARWNPRKGTPGFFLSDPARIQRLAPGYSGWFAGVPVRINSLELRDDREYQLDKAPNTFRILVLGDSVTFGHGSIAEHAYPRLLEDQLCRWRPDIDWQVWNAAVPGYNTSQELAQLLEVGPRFQPDLVIIGFFENDVVANYRVEPPGRAARARSAVLSFLYRHLYSIELYKRLYLQLAWRLSSANGYRLRLQHINEEEQLIAALPQVSDLKDQALTPFERLSDARVAAIDCSDGPQLAPDVLAATGREPGFAEWREAVTRLQAMNRAGAYRVMFFVNMAPLSCPHDDVFYDGGTEKLNRFFMDTLGDGAPTVSSYDAFRHLRPSQMPLASGHAIGNSNLVKADVLSRYLRDQVLPQALVARRPATSPEPRPR